MKPALPLNHIRSFECAARTLSFTAAAKELGYTQAAISSHIKALEHYLGWPLFIRLPRSLKLTEMGEAFLPTLGQSLGQIDAAAEAIITRPRSRTVNLSCPISLAGTWLAGCLAGFRKAHPDIAVVLNGIVWEDPDEEVADLTISIRRFDASPDGARLLWQDEIALLCAPDLAAGLKGPQDIAGHDSVLVMGRQEFWHEIARTHGIAQPPGGIVVNSTNLALELAVRGAGLVVTQRSLASVWLERGLLAEPFRLGIASPWGYYLRQNPQARGTQHRLLHDWLLSCAG